MSRAEILSSDKYLLTGDVARLLNVSAEMVRHWERSGKLFAQKTARGVRLFDPDAVERFAMEREKTEEKIPNSERGYTHWS